MGKPSRERTLAENEAKAVTKNLRVSPQKLNLVASLIRGKKVESAMADLEFSRKRIAQDVRKCVMSAVANAENNHGLDVNDLVVAEAYVGKNLIMKRFHARGRGRSSSIVKPFSQITVIVRQTDDEEKRPSRKTAKFKEADAAEKPAKRKKTAKASGDGKPAGGKAKAAKSKKPEKAGKAAKEAE